MFQYAEIPAEEIEKIISAYGRDVAVLPPQEIEAMIALSGFDTPVLVFQTFLIHAWYTQRTA
jgi:tRNA (cmo5U34)-methyltransferase